MNNANFKAVIFDLDGVITKTALVHSAAWKQMFDDYLRQRELEYEEPFMEFTHQFDYLTFVDGKPRYDGVKSFLESRGINLPMGDSTDAPDMETYCGIGNRKNLVFNDILSKEGIEAYESTVEVIHQLKANGISVGVASSSKNCENVLRTIGLIDVVEARVDGVVSAQMGLNGKPAPDIFTTAASQLGVACHQAVVVEDAISGVQAARNGNFGLVLGLAREDNMADLYRAGADVVVEDLADFGLDKIVNWFDKGLEEDSWTLTYHDYDLQKERSREALLTVGNGYFGSRGAMAETGITAHNYPGTYMAEVYNRLVSTVSGREVENEDLVNVSNWLPFTFCIDGGEWFDINKTKILRIKRQLNFKTGVLIKDLLVEDEQGRITQIYTRRFASMHNRHVAGNHYCMQPVNYDGTISIQSSLDGGHINQGVERYNALNQKHLLPIVECGQDNRQSLVVQTTQSGIWVGQTARLDVLYNGGAVNVDFKHSIEASRVSSSFSKSVAKGEYLGMMKTVWIDKDDQEITSNSLSKSLDSVKSFDEEMTDSMSAWEAIWKEIDVRIEGDRLSQKMLRMHLYHSLSATSPHNETIDWGIPARGLSGEAYRGHIFWDELYILPLYFVHFPQVAKAVLMYRYRRLDAARKYAAENGFRGAMFPWQSGSDGREETQQFHFNPLSGKWGDDHSALQRHVSLAIAYNVIQYYHFTQDSEFMQEAGLELLLEIARFWESKSDLQSDIQRYSIKNVMGPDEFHESYPDAKEGGITDNTYTNVMTGWMFNHIQSIVDAMNSKAKKAVYAKIHFEEKELHQWQDISKRMNLVISPEGILSQFDGYFDLQELDLEAYAKKYGNIQRMDRILKSEGTSPDEFKVAKQADTLMLFYAIGKKEVENIVKDLGYKLPTNYLESNLEYYLQRTSHGSTLSRVVHAYLNQLVGDKRLSWEMFKEAVTSDYVDIQGGTTAEGIHAGVMAGTVWLVYSAFAGIDFTGEIIAFKPALPVHWNSLELKFQFKGNDYSLELTHHKLILECNAKADFKVNGIAYQTHADKAITVDL